jgi:hypothetical protein
MSWKWRKTVRRPTSARPATCSALGPPRRRGRCPSSPRRCGRGCPGPAAAAVEGGRPAVRHGGSSGRVLMGLCFRPPAGPALVEADRVTRSTVRKPMWFLAGVSVRDRVRGRPAVGGSSKLGEQRNEPPLITCLRWPGSPVSEGRGSAAGRRGCRGVRGQAGAVQSLAHSQTLPAIVGQAIAVGGVAADRRGDWPCSVAAESNRREDPLPDDGLRVRLVRPSSPQTKRVAEALPPWAAYSHSASVGRSRPSQRA